ncbi:MAG: hypothetical protein C0177_04355 [Fervidicoccus fontis]|nr:MAG: hypothetical protein C0177_04355 [Fervidicoccus fontis]
MHVEIPVRPTEKEEILLKIVNFILVPEDVKVEGEGLGRKIIAISSCLSSLTKLHDLLRRERILDSARKFLYRGKLGNTITFMLHKQALAAGRVSFVSNENESPLGPVIVAIEHPKIDQVIDWLAPQTKEGRPLREIPVPEPDCVEDSE